jgi:hypothetical protein
MTKPLSPDLRIRIIQAVEVEGMSRLAALGPSNTIGAVCPFALSAPTNVVVFQWPCGIDAAQRVPRGERP